MISDAFLLKKSLEIQWNSFHINKRKEKFFFIFFQNDFINFSQFIDKKKNKVVNIHCIIESKKNLSIEKLTTLSQKKN
jgi:hypothetical protein